MKFDEKFIAQIQDDPIKGIMAVCDFIFESYGPEDAQEWSKNESALLFEGYAFLQVALETYSLKYAASPPEITGDVQKDSSAINGFLRELVEEYRGHAAQVTLESLKEQYKTALGASFSYEFSKGDLDRVQELISELRQEITDASRLEEDHRRRLLSRLERLQGELHKKVSDLDRFWGLVGDAGVALGKLGKDAKPIVDRIREISEIVWRTQARSEELPSDAEGPLITDESDNESKD